MRLLLDTHAFLWAIADEKLSSVAREAFLNTDNDLYLSAASYWEICIKVSIGKLSLVPDWISRFDTELASNGISWLTIDREHCQHVLSLPDIHRDPFDRMLIAQAQCTGMTLLTADTHIQQYAVSTLW